MVPNGAKLPNPVAQSKPCPSLLGSASQISGTNFTSFHYQHTMDWVDKGAKLVFDDSPQRDYNHATDSNYKRLRAEADKLYKKRHELSQQSQAAYKSGDGQKAHELSEESKKILDKAEDCNQKAAEYVFRENNADSAEDEIDLHGLYVKEAEFFLQIRIVQFVKTHQSHLNVIVGKGLHSKNGIAKLKPAIDEMCDESGLKHHIDSHNTGVLVINLANTSVERLPARWLKLKPSDGAYDSPAQPLYQQHHQSSQHHSSQQQHHSNNSNMGKGIAGLLLKLVCFCIKNR